MKKKILSFVFAICLIIPCAFIMTACGGNNMKVRLLKITDPGVKSIIVYDASEHAGNRSHSYATCIREEGLDREGRLPKENEYLVIIDLEEGYDYGDLQLKVTGEEYVDIMDLDKISNLLASISNPNYVDFEDSTLKGVLWRVGADAVDEIEVSLLGEAQKSRHTLSISQGESTYQDVANYQDLRLSLYVDNVVAKNADLVSEFAPADFLNFVNEYTTGKTFEYGQMITIKVWFDDSIVVFNNGSFVNVYDSAFGSYDPIAWEDRYYDTEMDASIYKFEIKKNTSVQLEWYDGSMNSVDYDTISLSYSDFANYYKEAENTIVHNDVLDVNAIFEIANVTELDYEILMKNYTTVIVNYNTTLTQAQKQSMFSYDDGKLVVNAGILLPINYNRIVGDGKRSFSDQSKNNFILEAEIDREAVFADNTVKTVKVRQFHNGVEFSDEFEVPTLPEGARLELMLLPETETATELGNNAFAFDGMQAEYIRLNVMYFPADASDTNNNLIQKIVVSDGTNSFDLTFNGEIFVGTSTIEGLTYEDGFFIFSTAGIDRIDTLSFDFHI